MKSASQGLSLPEMMVTLVLLSTVSLGAVLYYRAGSAGLVRSAATEVSRFIRSNHALSFIANVQTRIEIDKANSRLIVTSGPALSAPHPAFSTLYLKSPSRITSANFGDLNAQLVQLVLRPTGSASPGSMRIDSGDGSDGCSLIVGLRGSIQTLCD